MNNPLHSFRRVFPLLTLTGVLAVACGSSASQLVKSFSFKLEERKALLLTEFSTEVGLNMELAIPIRDLGWVRLIPSDGQKGFQISTELDFGAFVDPALAIGRTRSLPNGLSFPSYVSTDLFSVELKKEQNFNTRLYLGTSAEKKYVGVALELKFVDSRFPEGLSISQNIQDGSSRNVGVVSFYGPKMSNGQMVTPGGIFIASDINTLRAKSSVQGFTVNTAGVEMQSVRLTPYDGFDVEGKNARTYKRPDQQFRLFKLFKNAGRQAGLVD